MSNLMAETPRPENVSRRLPVKGSKAPSCAMAASFG